MSVRLRPLAALLTVTVGAFATACSGPAADGSQRIAWAIMDSSWSAPWDPMDDSIAVYRVMLARDSMRDTLTNVLAPWPVIINDSTVAGIQFVPTDSTRRLIWHTSPSRRTWSSPLPSDVRFQFTEVSISLTGEFLAYVATDSSSKSFAMVRDLATGGVRARGPDAAGCDCDVDMNHARWVTADGFEIAIANFADMAGGPQYLLTAGRASSRRVTTVGLAKEPEWHASRP